MRDFNVRGGNVSVRTSVRRLSMRAVLLVLVVLAGCTRRQAPAVEIANDAVYVAHQRAFSIAGEDEVTQVQWSPAKRCVAFTLANREGHSPLTTTRVMLARADGSGVREVRLPPPDERFSTRLVRWESGEALVVGATTLDSERLLRVDCEAR